MKNQEAWDNSGLQIGDYDADIKNIMLTLDVDLCVVEYAVNNNVDLIITHHPFLFSVLKSIDFSTYEGKIVREIIKNNINLYSMHTSFDMATYGVNYHLSQMLNINPNEVLHEVNLDGSGYGGIGYIEPINIIEYAKSVKKLLNVDYIKLYSNNHNKIVRKVAFCGGSGGEFIKDSINKNVDVYITGDIKFHQAQLALQNNLCIIDAGHYNTEYKSMECIKKVLDNLESINVKLLEKNTVNEIIIGDYNG